MTTYHGATNNGNGHRSPNGKRAVELDRHRIGFSRTTNTVQIHEVPKPERSLSYDINPNGESLQIVWYRNDEGPRHIRNFDGYDNSQLTRMYLYIRIIGGAVETEVAPFEVSRTVAKLYGVRNALKYTQEWKSGRTPRIPQKHIEWIREAEENRMRQTAALR